MKLSRCWAFPVTVLKSVENGFGVFSGKNLKLFLEKSGRNRTPDKLKADERRRLFSCCDHHLVELKQILEPEWFIGIGRFAEKRCREVFAEDDVRVGGILHPSPANPSANRNWGDIVDRQLREAGAWD